MNLMPSENTRDAVSARFYKLYFNWAHFFFFLLFFFGSVGPAKLNRFNEVNRIEPVKPEIGTTLVLSKTLNP